MHRLTETNIKPMISSKAMLFLLGISVVAFGVLSVMQIPQYVDVLGWDEGVYMQNGLLFSKKLQKNWGPMYAAWYYFLHFFQSFPLCLYYLNFQVLTVLPGFLLFVYWIRIGVRPLVAAIVAMFFIASYVNFYSWPKISLFTTSILIGAFIMGTFARNTLQKLIWVCGGVLIVSYMRPELYLAFVVLFLATIIYAIVLLIRRSAQGTFTWLMLSGLILIIAGLQMKLGNPLFSMEGARAIAAFAQHYAYNYTLWNDLRPDRWQLHGEQIFVADFGRNFDFFSAYKANSEAFIRHVTSNTIRYLGNLWKFYTDLFIPESIFSLKEFSRTVVLMLLLMPILLFRKFSLSIWWNHMKERWLEWLLLMIVNGPTFLSVILIFPREHYMVMQTLLLLTLLLTFSYGFTGWRSPVESRKRLGLVSGIMMGLLILTPSAKNRPAFDNFREPKGTFNKEAVLTLRQFELLSDTIRISEDEGGITFFLHEAEKQRFKWTPAMWKQTNFNHYADSMGTQLYYVTPLMLYDDRYRYDKEWHDFLTNYRDRGYEKKKIAEEWYFLYDTTAMRWNGKLEN